MTVSLRFPRSEFKRVAEAGRRTVRVALDLEEMAAGIADPATANRLRKEAQRLIESADMIGDALNAAVDNSL